MKKILVIALLATIAAPAFAGVGVSVNIGEPGFFGRIDLGDAPRPEVVYDQPVIIQRPQVVGQPVYLRVPPEHQRNWKRYCGRYNACGQPVYFVKDDWYNNTYAPHYREQHGHGHDDHGPGRGHDHHDDDHGPGRDHDRGHD